MQHGAGARSGSRRRENEIVQRRRSCDALRQWRRKTIRGGGGGEQNSGERAVASLPCRRVQRQVEIGRRYAGGCRERIRRRANATGPRVRAVATKKHQAPFIGAVHE